MINFGTNDKSTVTPEDRRMNKDLVTRAGLIEIDCWKEYNVFKEMPSDEVPQGANVIRTRFVET